MKLNNKGFLITGILYSLLFLVLILGMVAILNARQNKLDYISKDIITKLNDKYDFDVAKVWEFDYTGNYQTFTVPTDGYYEIELWGAQGGNYSNTIQGGKGAYSKGIIYLTKGENLYIYVGGQPTVDTSKNQNEGGYNGGGLSGYHTGAISTGGGGATDIRLEPGNWDNFTSLKSRIMVAAGGGGTAYASGFTHIAGAGGAFYGVNGTGSHNANIAYGGSQNSGGFEGARLDYPQYYAGLFGKGAPSTNSNIGWGGGAGSGYYGGALGFGHGGGGGSSFVSGLYGCNAITKESTADAIVHTDQPNHYSGKVFYNGMMIAGDLSMPTHEGTSTMIGNEGNGYAKISLMSSNPNSYAITNMIKNGSYEFGTDSWNNLYDVSITEDYKYIENYSLKMDIPKTYSYNYSTQNLNLSSPTLGHKYYGRIYYYSTVEMTLKSRVEWWVGDANRLSMLEFNPYFLDDSISFKIGNGWKFISNISSVTSDSYLDKTWVFRNFTYSNNNPIYSDGLILVDLTETFGEGNEPTKEWCDENISYFDGEITIYK